MASNPVQEKVKACTRCSLHKLYDGPVPIQLLRPGFLCVGEAPGAEEDQNGIPFSGPSGRFLRMRLREAKVPPGRTSFANVISCRPHDNRNPSNWEKQRCRGNLLAQISVADPRVIILLGKTALQSIYPYGVPKNDNGRILYYGKLDNHSVWMLPTWHPAFIIRPGGRQYEDKWVSHLKLASKLISKRPGELVDLLPTTCRVCGNDVDAYDVMAGAWCKYHYKEVPRQIWQDELPIGSDMYDPNSSTGKKKKQVDKRARKMGLL